MGERKSATDGTPMKRGCGNQTELRAVFHPWLPPLLQVLPHVQFRQRHVPFAIEDVVRAKRDDVPAGKDVVDAALHQPADVEVVGVEERCDRDPEHIGGGNLVGEDTREEIRCYGVQGVRPAAGCQTPLCPATLCRSKRAARRASSLLRSSRRRPRARYCSTSCLALGRVNEMPLAKRSAFFRESMIRVSGKGRPRAKGCRSTRLAISNCRYPNGARSRS